MADRANWAALVPWSGIQNRVTASQTEPSLVPELPGDPTLFYNGDGGFTKPSTAGASTPTGPAGGDLAGTYPNPNLAVIGSPATVGSGTLVPVVGIDAKGRVVSLSTTPVTPTGGPPSGPAGGGLGGTYPNPSVTPAPGLDTSAVHSGDAAGGFLGGTYPNPTGPASLPPNGAAGGDLAGTYPNPTVNKIAPSSPNNKINWNLRYFVEDYATVQLALTAAANAHGVLMLPPGVTQLAAGGSNLGLQLPNGFTGYVGIIGCGSKVSILKSANAACAGVTLDMSAANPSPSSFIDTGCNLEGFSILSNNAGCTTALTCSYGTTSPGSISGKLTGVIRDVEVLGGGWAAGFYLLNCWNWQLVDIYGAGDSTNSGTYVTGTGPGDGAGISFDSCVNCRLTNCGFEWWRIGLSIPSGSTSVGPSQGIQVSTIEMLECVNCINSYGTLYVNHILFDNGNLLVTSKCSIVLQGSGSNGSQIIGGQILQDGGANMIQLNNTANCKITGIDFEYNANLTGYIIRCYTGTRLCVITGNTADNDFCQLDSGSSVNRVNNNELNGGINLDNGTNNSVGDVTGVSPVFTVPGSPGTAFYVSTSISGADCGKKPTGVLAQCVDDPTYQVQYDYNAVGGTTTATTLWLKVTLFSGGSMAAFVGNAHQYNVILTP
jgi:hypothetical protein